MGRTVPFLVIMFLVSGVFANAVEDRFRSEMDFARKAVKDGFYVVAENKLTSLLDLDIPEKFEAEVHMLLGRIYYERSLLRRAIQEFDFVLEHFRDNDIADMAVYWTAEVYFKEENSEQALAAYQSVLNDYPSSRYAPYSSYSQAWCYEKLGEHETAVEMFRETAKAYPQDKVAIKAGYKTAEILHREGRDEEAIAELKAFIEKYPVNERIFDAYYMLGDCYYRTGDFKNAAANLGRSLQGAEDRPWEALAGYKIARSCVCLSDGEKAEEWFTRVNNDSTDPDLRGAALMGLAGVYKERNETEKAIGTYRKILSDCPENRWTDDAYYWLGEALYGKGDWPGLIDVYRRALKRYPGGEFSNNMHYDLARAYLNTGDEGKALKEFDRTVEMSDNEDIVVSALCGIGDILEGRGEDDHAVDVYDRILRDHPHSI
ncbi:MAG: tetratricopeptide repeat protein, partial [Candidatus Omnitrophica bacterium]|nr:tetratricopeptide repeat protein [Candidatus Omnitrophota bacterium]